MPLTHQFTMSLRLWLEIRIIDEPFVPCAEFLKWKAEIDAIEARRQIAEAKRQMNEAKRQMNEAKRQAKRLAGKKRRSELDARRAQLALVLSEEHERQKQQEFNREKTSSLLSSKTNWQSKNKRY